MKTITTLSGFVEQYEELKFEYEKLLARHTELKELTNKELIVFEKLLSDFTVEKIADMIGISFSTVKFHCKNIYRKLAVKSRAQLLVQYKDLY